MTKSYFTGRGTLAIAQLREEQGLSQMDFAVAIGYPPSM
jgi:DNA-binding transcriptional regulator YiaG